MADDKRVIGWVELRLACMDRRETMCIHHPHSYAKIPTPQPFHWWMVFPLIAVELLLAAGREIEKEMEDQSHDE